jgi:hypothetical protein
MAFITIPATWIDPDSPVTDELWGRVKDNEDFLNSQVGGGPTLPSNGSFEIDTDADGVPDNWTRTLSAGGAGVISTSISVHGKNSFQFTFPSGAGNGGGFLKSDSFDVNNVDPFNLSFSIQRSASAGAKNEVIVDYLNGALTTVGSETVYSATSEASTGWISKTVALSPPNSSAVIAQVSIIGGTTDIDSSGITRFDDVFMSEGVSINPGDVPIAASTVAITWTSVSSPVLLTTFQQSRKINTKQGGEFRTEYTIRGSSDSARDYFSQWKRNGVFVGTSNVLVTGGTADVTVSEDLIFDSGDTVALFIRAGTAAGGNLGAITISDVFLKTDNEYTITLGTVV